MTAELAKTVFQASVLVSGLATPEQLNDAIVAAVV